MNYHFEKMPNELFEKIIIEISKHPIQRLIPYLNNYLISKLNLMSSP